MNISFYKYQGTGNDFIIIDNRTFLFDGNDYSLIARLCHRKFGIGADGLILLNNKAGFDFEMIYYNSDGKQGTMCGNGGRCIVAFALKLGIIKDNSTFLAIDDIHEAKIIQQREKEVTVKLKMSDVKSIERDNSSFFLNTGSPHYVQFIEDLEKFDVFNQGKAIRYNERFFPKGTNVDFVEQFDDYLFVRTYERGVENETLSCGSGVTASALVYAMENDSLTNKCNIKTLGGLLTVHFERVTDSSFQNIWLEGPTNLVFNGEITI